MTRRLSLRGVSDAGLITQAGAGDHDAFAELVRRHEATIYRFAFKVCRNHEKAAEALQDTLIQLYRRLGSFDARSKFSTWLYTVVLNSCRMRHRRTKMDDLLESLDAPPADGTPHPARTLSSWEQTPAEQLMNKELRQSLEEAIGKLPMDYRAVFVLRDLEGASTAEAAKVLRISAEAVKSRLRRARAFLRDELDHFMREGVDRR